MSAPIVAVGLDAGSTTAKNPPLLMALARLSPRPPKLGRTAGGVRARW